jgi:hypothetical protein
MPWHRTKGARNSGSRPLADYDRLPPTAEPDLEDETKVNYPVAVDPETGHIETIGKGRIAIIGSAGVERLVTLPASEDLIDTAIARGDLSHGA